MTEKFQAFDVETTGLHLKAPKGAPPIPADHPHQPRVCSFAGIVCDEFGREISRQKFYVKPEGWTMAEFTARARAEGKKAAVDINGLTDEKLNDLGVPIAEVLDYYVDAIERGLIVSAFNAQFDTKMMRGELRRAGRDDLFEQTANICTMKALQPYAAEGLCIMRGFVKLQEAADFFGFDLDNHEVMSDTIGVQKLLEILIRDNRLPEPKILRAKNYQGDKPAPTSPSPRPPSDGQTSTPPPVSAKDDGFSVPDKF